MEKGIHEEDIMTCYEIPRGGLNGHPELSPGAVVCDDGVSPAEGFGVAEDYGVGHDGFFGSIGKIGLDRFSEANTEITEMQHAFDRGSKQSQTWYGKAGLWLTGSIYGVVTGFGRASVAVATGIPVVAHGLFSGEIGPREIVEGLRYALVSAGTDVGEGVALMLDGKIAEGVSRITEGGVNVALMIQGGVALYRGTVGSIVNGMKNGGGSLLALPDGQVLTTASVASETVAVAATSPWRGVAVMAMSAYGKPTRVPSRKGSGVPDTKIAEEVRNSKSTRGAAEKLGLSQRRVQRRLQQARGGELAKVREEMKVAQQAKQEAEVMALEKALKRAKGNRTLAGEMTEPKLTLAQVSKRVREHSRLNEQFGDVKVSTGRKSKPTVVDHLLDEELPLRRVSPKPPQPKRPATVVDDELEVFLSGGKTVEEASRHFGWSLKDIEGHIERAAKLKKGLGRFKNW